MISATALTMRYGPVLALDRAEFDAAKGAVAGLLGPNGAGKSTTLKILTTFLVPTSGNAVVAGHSVVDEPLAVRKQVGYLPEALPLYSDMEVGEYLRFVAAARGVARDRMAARIDWAVRRCGLKSMFRRPVWTLSKGYRQRTALAQALIHDPSVVILDEPTSGLDPHQILEVRALIRELAADKTVILSTHILHEASAIADRIVIINRGRVAGRGTLDELRRQARRSAKEDARVRVSLRGPTEAAMAEWKKHGSVASAELIREAGGEASFWLMGKEERALLAAGEKTARERGWTLTELSPCPPTLEETFLRLTETVDNEAG